MIFLILLILTSFVQADEGSIQPQPKRRYVVEENELLTSVTSPCFRNKLQAEALQQSVKGYELIQVEDHYCVQPEGYVGQIVFVTED